MSKTFEPARQPLISGEMIPGSFYDTSLNLVRPVSPVGDRS
jgi:hypothetical protein